MKVYPVLGRVSVPVIQFLITPANVAARKIKCVYENWITRDSVHSHSHSHSHSHGSCGGERAPLPCCGHIEARVPPAAAASHLHMSMKACCSDGRT